MSAEYSTGQSHCLRMMVWNFLRFPEYCMEIDRQGFTRRPSRGAEIRFIFPFQPKSSRFPYIRPLKLEEKPLK